MYKIINAFHGTTTTTKYGPRDRLRIAYGHRSRAEYQAMRRAKRKLCGATGCTCSDDWGVRSYGQL